MRISLFAILCVAAVSSLAPGQVIYYHTDSNPASGAANTIPWGQTGGYTTLHFYTADQLQSAGVAPSSVLTDVAVAPTTVGPGVYNAPSARMMVGHLQNDTQVPGAWTTTLDTPTIVHDIASGPYTFPWSGGTWVSLPGFAAAGFTWDGLRDIGIFYTSSAGTTGGFTSLQPGVNPRFGVTTFNATNQIPTTTGFFAMKVRLTFNGTPPTTNTLQASMNLNGTVGATHLYGNDTLNLNLSSTTAASQPFFLFASPSFTGFHLPLTGQSFDLGAAPAAFADVLVVSGAGIFPFLTGPYIPLGGLDPLGNFTLPVPLACGSPIAKLYLQAAISDPGHPDGLRITGISSLDVKPSCRYASSSAFPIAIPDAGAPVTATITVPPGTIIGDLDVVVQMTHQAYGNLSMSLDLNGITTVQMMVAGPADTSDVNGRYQFSDEGLILFDTAATTSGTGLIPGRYIPDNVLSVFDGLDAGGTWTLTVSDTTATNVGSIQGLSILINGVE